MPTRSYHGVTLWAVPRFHRADILPTRPGLNAETGTNQTGTNQSGTEWMARLKTYSFPLRETCETPVQAGSQDLAEIRH